MIPLAGRRLAKELVADGLTLPAGTDVTPAIWLTHTRADVYPEPFAFKPERFLEEGPDTYAWIPFGGSVRRCIGATFAEFEMRIVLREVLTRCELRKADPRPERTGRRNITLSPKDGTPVVVTARQPGARAGRGLTTRFEAFRLHSSHGGTSGEGGERGELERRAAGRTEPDDERWFTKDRPALRADRRGGEGSASRRSIVR